MEHCLGFWNLVAANQADADISIVDAQTAKEVARVPEGAITGHEVATALDGITGYVTIYGDSSVGDAGTDGRELLAIDLASRKIVGRLDFGQGVRPHGIAMNSQDGLLYVATELDRTVTIVDPKTFKIVGSISTGQVNLICLRSLTMVALAAPQMWDRAVSRSWT